MGQANQAENMLDFNVLVSVSLDKPASFLRDVRVRVMGQRGWGPTQVVFWDHPEPEKQK